MPVSPVRLRRALATACALGAAGVLSPVTAAASVPGADDGRWYYEATGLAELHERTTGEGVTVAVLDGRVNTAAPDLVGADVQPHEPSYCAAEEGGTAYPGTTSDADAKHATSIATMISGTDAGVAGAEGIPGVAPGATLRTYAVIVDGSPCATPQGQEPTQDDAIHDAIADGAQIIAVPGSNNFSSTAVGDALRAGAIVIGAGGNDGAISGMPATANGVVTVGTVASDVTLAEGSPSGSKLSVVAPGARIRALAATWDAYGTTTGSSNATAYTAGVLALLWSLYPDATAGQILQALIHTTDGEVKATPAHDWEWGYGTVSARSLLSVDPTTYPDENPFLLDDGRQPLVSDVLGTPDDAASADPQEDPVAGPADDDADAEPPAPEAGSPFPTPAVLTAGAVLVLIIGGVVVVSTRRRRTTGSEADAASSNNSGGNNG
jgi:hypothetical protein